MGFLERWREFRRRRTRTRQARRLFEALFERPDLRRISSLRPEHRSRAVFLDYDADGDDVVCIRFGLVRHPQPIRVRGVHDEVVELYLYDVRAGVVDVASSRNMTRKGAPPAARGGSDGP